MATIFGGKEHQLSSVISTEHEAQVVRVGNDPILDISMGLYNDRFTFHRFGFNGNLETGVWEDIWDYDADSTYNWPATDETFRVKSGGNAADTSGGAGARTIVLEFLDSKGNEVSETLTLAGASASAATSVTGYRVQRAYVSTAGTINGNNTAAIIIENTSSNLVVGHIEAATGQTLMSMFSVPLGFTAYLMRVHVDVAVGTNKDCDIRLWQRPNNRTRSAPFGAKIIVKKWTELQGQEDIVFRSTPAFAELTDIWMEAKATATSACDIDYDLVCIRNT